MICGQLERRARRVGGRLEHDRVAGGERGSDLPHRHHEGEVPGDDLPADAERLALDEVRRLRRELRHLDLASAAAPAPPSRRSSAAGRSRASDRRRSCGWCRRESCVSMTAISWARACRPSAIWFRILAAVRLAHARPGPVVEGRARRLDGALRVLATGARDACPGLLGGRVDGVYRLARLQRDRTRRRCRADTPAWCPPSCGAESGSAYPSLLAPSTRRLPVGMTLTEAPAA